MAAPARHELDDDTQDRRWALVEDVFARLTSRPGRTVTNGISVIDDAVADVVTGDVSAMAWSDEPALERLGRAVADPAVADADLTYHVAFAAASAELAADAHELCEHFTVDGVRVFDPHPTRFGDSPVVDFAERGVVMRRTVPYLRRHASGPKLEALQASCWPSISPAG